jgi:hypothetical protein
VTPATSTATWLSRVRSRLPGVYPAPAIFVLLVISAISTIYGQTTTVEPQFDPRPWIEDFHQLLHEMSTHYANLEWSVTDRRMDLPDLRKKTEDAITNSHSDAEARAAIRNFLDAFGDGHLEIDWPSGEADVAQTKPAADVCERLGYHPRGKPGLDYSLIAGLTPLNSPQAALFPGGLLKLADGRTLGLIRIGVFMEKAFPDVCRQAIQQIGVAAKAACDDVCADKVELKTANLLTAALTARADTLRQAGATALLIDITRNGGGTDWVDAVPRALSSKPLKDPRQPFVKSDHWTEQLEESLKNVEADQHSGHENDPVLREARAKLQEGIAASKEHCDAGQVWITGKLNCSLLANDFRYASGVLPYASPGSFAGYKSQDDLFYPGRYAYTETANRLPLYVLVDNNTWSAAEYFAALLQDSRAATIIGELTGGAGCGYTNDGIPAQLKNSKAEVKMPDCVRLRADGSNEVNGVTPDVLIPWAKRDSPYQRAQKLLKALNSMPRVFAVGGAK